MADTSKASSGLARYQETSLAFDDLIVQVGRAIARAQEEMDLSQLNFQRQVMQALQDGRMRRLDVNPANAYTIPETTLHLKIGLSMQYAEGEETPTLSAVPLNATTTNQNDISVEAATEVKLRFVSVPQSQEPPGPAPSALTAAQVLELAQKDRRVAAALAKLQGPQADLGYDETARQWLLVYLDAREPALVVLVDDRLGTVSGVVFKRFPPAQEELEPIGPPRFERVSPVSGRHGDILTIHGDNFLTLAGQTILKLDEQPIPLVRLSMDAVAFKIPEWVIRGDVEIITPLGTTGETGKAAFVPLPGMERFEPAQGYFDATRQRGTWFSVYGHNLRPGCNVRFATGVQGRNVQIVSPGQMQVEVPEGAGSGPLTLVFGEHQQSLAASFVILPRVERVSPRQARVGDEVTITGNTLGEITQVLVGNAIVTGQDFTLHTPGQIRFRVPPDASDGSLRIRLPLSAGEYYEVVTRDIFYVVPRITGFGAPAVVAGQLLTIYGEGLDPDPEMMALLFDAKGGLSEAPVLAVAPDHRSLTTRVPLDAVTGFVLLLRKRVYSETSAADTSNTSLNKLTVLTPIGDLSDLILEERFSGDLARWASAAGKWHIDQGLLASEGTARLEQALPESRNQLTIYADVLKGKCFGFSLTPPGAEPRLQVWVNLAGTSPALTWSSLDTQNNQRPLGDRVALDPLLLVDKDHLVQLSLAGGKVTLSLGQAVVHTYEWGEHNVELIGLLANDSDQRWDNVVVLKGDYLSLAEPDFYRFAGVPELPTLPPLRVDSFEPAQGAEGTEVTLSGIGLDEAARFFFGSVQATVLEATGTHARVRVPTGARTGPIEVHGRGGVITTTGDRSFVAPPRIMSLVPARLLAGQQLNILGTNLPAVQDAAEVEVLGQPAQIVAASASMLTVLVPDVVGTGVVSVSYSDFVSQAPEPLEVHRENVVLDLVQGAQHAGWMTSGGAVNFGALGEAANPSVQLRPNERMEDGLSYAPVLYVHPPSPVQRALRGLYPAQNAPEGRLELRLEFGMLWSAAPAAEEVANVDGVIFEVGYLVSATGEELPLLPRTTCVHDGSIERFVIDANQIAGQRGQLIVSIFAGRTGLRDDAALIRAELIQLT